ncbi:signal recognition particle-docking protein FtsY [Levilactobacillus suantsaiihabitans]|uniref:Signal recognition particle receptor FtsY n=1 Tax=Levilactobacillus suantsaiihabitans TaxID=2487722 RepID=A0A4Z0J8A3_9LACO|nr:signal recognition particle-docking protein FtsY [Levilactobacillus suantsaiihabitans]TGD17894.1 signal recognition particle-docking protein FtsY [Levilactobacillus suantsaiihabitans]
MGLFDIFRRRAKKEPTSTAPASSAAAEEATTSSAASSAAPESGAQSVASAAPSQAPVAPTSSAAPSSAAEAPVAEKSTAASVAPVTSEAATSEAAAVAPEATPASVASEAPVTEKSAAPVSSAAASAATEPAASVAPTSVAPEAVPSSAAATSAAEATPVAPSSAAPVEDSADTPAAPAEKTDEQLYDKGLEKTRTTFGQKLNALLANFRHVDESFFDDLEETLIGADVGFDMAVKLSDELRDEVKLQNAKKSADVQNVVVEKLVEIYDEAGNNESTALNMATTGPTVILFVGVNGVGKTTTIGKMANRYHQAGKKVLLAAADTFRAGATEQLDVWAKRADVDIVTGKPQSDPAAVVFDAVQKAKKEDYDILFVDTAGRLQNKVNLMNELEKMKRIITREIPDAPHEVLLVLDATTGQNALTQAKLFKESTDVTGIVLTKLDGTARGGIVLAIRNELHVPVKFIGLGEQISDLRPFDPNEFVYGLFKGLIDVNALEKKA